MVDKALFIGTSGAKNSVHELEIITNNLANINTTGFREDYQVMKQYQVDKKQKRQSRAYSVMQKTYSDFKSGPILHTDRTLDVAISGKGFIAVQSKSGKEGYTRAGDLQIKNGILTTQNGEIVLGTSGVINMGNAQKFSIGSDGTISARLPGERNLITINQIKLVDPPVDQLEKGKDGLFYLPGDASALKRNNDITLISGALEGSNVNPVVTLTDLIEVSRQFEMHTDLMKTIKEDATKANEILELR